MNNFYLVAGKACKKLPLRLVFLLTSLMLSFQLVAQQVIPLYPGTAPGSEKWDWDEQEFFVKFPINGKVAYNITKPTLTVFSPDSASANGAAVLLIPGGGFHIVNFEHEGIKVAKELNAKGYTAFLLKYRVARSLSDDPFSEMMQTLGDSAHNKNIIALIKELALQDAKVAMNYIRQQAARFHLFTNKIGIAGFSAGGSLARTLATDENAGTKPDFVALIYSVFKPEETIIPPHVPPAFIACASDDKLASSINSVHLYNSWMAAAKNAELHIYVTGGHGLKAGNASSWMHRWIEWMQLIGF